MDAETESYILLLLSDGNLPTGSFVASSGLEAYVKHGFFALSASQTSDSSLTPNPSPPSLTRATINFIRDSMQTYARSTLPFISAIHKVCQSHAEGLDGDQESAHGALMALKELDDLYQSMTLNHVARRASTAQGVALLTLLSRGLVQPAWLGDPIDDEVSIRRKRLERLSDDLKLQIRKGNAHGHLPICWGVLTATLGLSCERSQHLHIFLHARSLVSASIRLNTLGPYAAQQLLLHVVRPLIDDVLSEASRNEIRLVARHTSGSLLQAKIDDDYEDGPASTWPLGEILAARHDLQHSRIFNS